MTETAVTWLFGTAIGIVVLLVAYNLFLRKIPGVKALNAKWVNMILIVLLIANVVFGINVTTSTPASLTGAVTGTGAESVTVLAAPVSLSLVAPASNCTASVLTTNNQVYVARCDDIDTNDVISDFNTTVTVIRSDCSAAGGYPVTLQSDYFRSPSNSADVTLYNIIDQDNDNTAHFYVDNAAITSTTSGTKLAPQATSGKFGGYTLGFAEGVCEATLGVAAEFDESAADELNQYDTVRMTVNVGSTPFYIDYTDLDAAA